VKYPRVIDEHETVRAIIRHRASIARYGDGEFKLCLGRSAIAQAYDPELSRRLREILIEDNPLLMVGIPRIVNRSDWPTPAKGIFWGRYAAPRITSLLAPGRPYFSSFITRPDSGSGLYEVEYWQLVKQIWAGRRLTIVKGEGTGLDKRPALFAGADGPPNLILGPKTNAWRVYRGLLAEAMREPVENLILISLGPTATVMAADLALRGRQALDLGHMGMFYAGVHPKCERAIAA
jgi:hypothetical protein